MSTGPRGSETSGPGDTAADAGQHRRGVRPRAMVASVPLVLLLGVLFYEADRHFHAFVAWTSIAPLVALAASPWKLLPDDEVTEARLAMGRALTSRLAAVGFSIAFVVVVLLSLLVTSVHVEAETKPEKAVMVYRMRDADGGGEPRILDSLRLEPLKNHRHYYALLGLAGRREWLQASTHKRTPTFELHRRAALRIGYPSGFDSVVTVAMLPMSNFGPITGPDRPLSVVVAEDTTPPVLLAQDTLREVRALMLSPSLPPSPDSLTRQRWLRVASTALGVDTSAISQLVTDWMNVQWVRTTRPLRVGERVRFIIRSSDGNTRAMGTLTLSGQTTDAIIYRSP